MDPELSFSWCSYEREESGLHARVEAAIAAWRDPQPCAAWEAVDAGECRWGEDIDVDLAFIGGDPNEEIGEGVIYVSYTMGETAFVVLNDDVDFTSDEAVAAGECVDQMNLDSLLRRAVGVGGLGLTAPDCDEGCGWDEETSQLAGDARTCEARDLSDYDQDQVLHRYGPVTIESDQLSFQGEAPMEVCVTATGAAPELAVALGDFGDGTIVEGLDACHTYTEDGRYAIQALLGWTEECGGYVHEPILWSIVTVCSEADGSCAGDTGEAGGQSTDCGCAATTGATAVGALAVLAAAIVRARRRGGPPFTS